MTAPPSARNFSWKPLAVVIGGAIVCALVLSRSPLISGPSYWRWAWRDRASVPWLRFYIAMLVASAPMIGAWFVSKRSVAIALLCASVIAMKLISATIITTPMSFAALEAIVRSPDATSYYSDAQGLANFPGWLAQYPSILELPQINLHTKSKPPGAVAFYMMWIRAVGPERAPIASAICIAIISALSIPAMYWLISLVSPNRNAALCAAALLGLCPGYVLIFPTLDSCYPILMCLLLGTWHLALTRDDWRFAVAMGIVLSVTCFMTYNLLVLGAILIAWPFAVLEREKLVRVIRAAIFALLTFVTINAIFFLATAFNPIATFQSAYHNQQMLLEQHRAERPYPWTILFDLTDFSLGAGWVMTLLVIFAFVHRSLRRPGWRDEQSKIILIGLAQIVLVAVLGILQSETVRAWNFMLPLLIFPAALELSRWSRSERVIACAVMLIVLIVIGHNMVFLNP